MLTENPETGMDAKHDSEESRHGPRHLPDSSFNAMISVGHVRGWPWP